MNFSNHTWVEREFAKENGTKMVFRNMPKTIESRAILNNHLTNMSRDMSISA